MHRSRPVRFIAALIALVGMLFTQLAVASYICPGMTMVHGDSAIAVSADSADQDMADCQHVDNEQPNLCQAYDHAGSQSLDKPELPQVHAFVATGLAFPLIPVDIPYFPKATMETARLARSTAPPLSIRHCCFRI